jgi:hypothetical protein
MKNSGIDFSDKTQVPDCFKKDFGEWNSVWHELSENAATPFNPRPIYCMPPDHSWQTLPNLTLTGDATLFRRRRQHGHAGCL